MVQQAYNAEKAGAKAIIVMDNRSESLLTMSNPEERPELAKLKNDISIPAGLVQKVSCLHMSCEHIIALVLILPARPALPAQFLLHGSTPYQSQQNHDAERESCRADVKHVLAHNHISVASLDAV